MNQEKYVLICEQSNAKLEKVSDKYVFEGVFTQFGIENNNGRIYEEKEFLSHLEYLQKKIDKNMLVGELDHPEKFDVQYAKASHIIEKLEYNKDKRQIVGRIRILDTTSGKEARALIDGGVQLSISSRAAGSVDENKKVHLKHVFTYDIVGDPGFESANLNRVSENYGFDTESNIQLYEFKSDINYKEKDLVLMDKKITESTNNDYVSEKEFTKWINKLTSLIDEKNDTINKLELEISETKGNLQTTYGYLQEEVQNNINYLSMLAEHTDNLISYGNEITERQNSFKRYFDAITEKINETITEQQNIIKFSNYIMETVENSVKYSENINETVEQVKNYAEYTMEHVKNSVDYSEHIMETLELNTKYTESIVEEVKLLERHQDHFAESANALANFTQYVKDNLEHHINFTEQIAESIYNNVPNLKRVDITKNSDNFIQKIDELIEGAKKQEAPKDIFENYFNLLNDSTKNEFLLLPTDQKEKVIAGVKEFKPLSESEFRAIWDKVLTPVNVVDVLENIISNMPDEYKPVWNSLNENEKTRLLNQSALYNLNSTYAIKNFWYTRKELNEAKELQLLYPTTPSADKLNESATTKTQVDPYMEYISNALSR